MTIPADVAKKFPNLNLHTACCKSRRTPKYNCIAFAAGDTDHWWWPNEDGYWPEGVRRDETVEAFVAAYATVGYSLCDTDELEEGFEKIAIYATPKSPSHAAIQLPDGRWASKLGGYEDIHHDSLTELMVEEYGMVVCFLKRPIQKVSYEERKEPEGTGKFPHQPNSPPLRAGSRGLAGGEAEEEGG